MTEEEESAIVPVTDARIRNLIYIIRDEQVMLDSNLAELYDVETKRLNEVVTRNKVRFPEHSCFRLTKEEDASLRSQIVISNDGGRGGRRHPPCVFTEQGVSMLSVVLHSDTAIEVSICIMDALVEICHFIASNVAMFEQIRTVEHIQYHTLEDRYDECVFTERMPEKLSRVYEATKNIQNYVVFD
jgi:hypothetical protein